MRPESHRTPEQGCGTCKFSRLVATKLDLLCFHGDNIEGVGISRYPVESEYVELDGIDVCSLDGDGYDRVWAGRVVDPCDICDAYAREEKERER